MVPFVRMQAKPTGIIGLSGAGRLFTENVLRLMGEHHEQPIIMPMSNPTHRMECTAEDAQRMTGAHSLLSQYLESQHALHGGHRYRRAACDRITFSFIQMLHLCFLASALCLSVWQVHRRVVSM